MKGKGALTAISITIIIVILFVYNYVSFGHNIVNYLLLLLLPVVWWLAKQYEILLTMNEKLTNEKKILKENETIINGKISDYENLLDSLEVAIFSFDKVTNSNYFSEGIEEISGYSAENLGDNSNVWKEIVHPEDFEKVLKSKEQLHSGQSINAEYRIIHPRQGIKWVTTKASPILGSNGMLLKVNGYIYDITERKELESKLKYMAYYDELTDIPNRKLLDRHIGKALARSRRHHHNFTLMFIDLDDFKKVNDTLGHEAGDILLKEVVNRLNQSIREEDLISRIGGDEFIVVFEETSKKEIEEIAQRIIEKVAVPYNIEENEARISLSIGISMYPDDGEDKETLIDHADKAMYFAKNNGKNNYKIYTPDLNELQVKKVGLLEKWVDAIQNSRFFN